MKDYDAIVIGGGPAGISASRVFGKASPRINVALIRPEPHSMIYCVMPYVIQNTVSLEKTFKLDSLVTDNGVELIRDKVNKVDFVTREVWTEKGRYRFQKLLIATGANPALPLLPGIELPGVMTFKNEPDLVQLLEQVDNVKRAVVVGAGAIGVELAQALNVRGIKVHLVDIQDHILPSLVDRDMAMEAQELLASRGIKLRLNNRVVSLNGEDKVEKVILADGEDIGCDEGDRLLVIFSVGMKADISMFAGTELSLGRNGILVNARMETNIPGVYAAGDCAEYKSALTGHIIDGKLATNAVPMGKIAALNILGGKREYPGFYNGGATKVYNLRLGGTGFTEKLAAANGFDPVAGYGETTTRFPMIPGTGKLRVKLVVDRSTRRLIGGQVVGSEAVAERIDLLTFAMQTGSVVDQLEMLAYSAQPYQTFLPANNAIVMAAGGIMGHLGLWPNK